MPWRVHTRHVKIRYVFVVVSNFHVGCMKCNPRVGFSRVGIRNALDVVGAARSLLTQRSAEPREVRYETRMLTLISSPIPPVGLFPHL